MKFSSRERQPSLEVQANGLTEGLYNPEQIKLM